ncbi:hypothetical protein [Streptosporangium sp. CA-115845]|uniref:hypothetical protein n=1 Tax=Streptosporangium sp. CA-115845 TaxID=3240071 RepID=UPI003D8D2D98
MGLALAIGLTPVSAAQALAPAQVPLSTMSFDGEKHGVVKTTRKIWVPKGGKVGVYGRNTGFATLYISNLDFRVYQGSTDITNQFWRRVAGDYFLREGEVINKRLVNSTGAGRYYYIWARCDTHNPTRFSDCDGVFTVSSWK